MSDEQTIYISPEDDLTTVRERLENITSKRVTLVIPSHTQLRSHVAWKLLYARSRELGKEVLIVSSDPQVRSVAHAVKFKVAHSLESNPQGRSRPTSRPARSTNVRGKPTTGRSAKGQVRNSSNLRQRSQEIEEEAWYAPTPEKRGAPSSARAVPDYRIEDVNDDDITDVAISPRYGRTEKPRQSTFDYRIDQVPPIAPIRPSDQNEDDQAMLAEDYKRAQDIREAAGAGPGQARPAAISPTPGPMDQAAVPNERLGIYRVVPMPQTSDPFIDQDDLPAAPVREQRGNATIENMDASEHENQDMTEMPTSIIKHVIEYQGDNDDALPPTSEPGTQGSWNRSELIDEEDDDPSQDSSRRVHGTRSRRSRSGYLSPSAQGRQPDNQSPVESYDTRINPINPRPHTEPTTSSTPVSRIGARDPDPMQLPPPTRGGPRPADIRSTGPRSGNLRSAGPRSSDLRSAGPRSGDLRSQGASTARPAMPVQRPTTGQAASTRKPVRGRTSTRRTGIVLIAVVVAMLLALALLVYAGPAAHVTLTVMAHNYTHSLDLTANLNNQAGALPAHIITREFPKKGSEPASGSKLVGTARSKGFVCFSNKSDASVEIPTGSVVAASNSVQFATTADGVVLPHSTCVNDPLTFPIQAVKPGETGNVAAGSITVIPDGSLDSIAKYNKVTKGSLQLAVSNGDDVKGGGMQPVSAITDKDLSNAKTDLSNQLKGEIDGWVQSLAKDGVTGNVVTNATLVNPPAKDTTIDNGTTFSAEVNVKATVLFVSNTDLQTAALHQLMTEIQKDKNYTGYSIAEDVKPAITLSQPKKQADANSIKLTVNATAQAIPIIPKDTVQKLVSGKTPGEARKVLLSSIRGVQDANIQVTPGFFPWVSWWPGHIDVTELPGSASNSPPTHP
ncbi:MAG: hypothetical protein NVS2B12_12590 [Ktedonobacteraceae bacterium]